MITDKARKVLKLALHERTSDEEWQTAAAALVWAWRRAGLTDEDLFPLEEEKPPLIFMPFGKFKGRPFHTIPINYLHWIYVTLENLSPELRDRINFELQNRDK